MSGLAIDPGHPESTADPDILVAVRINRADGCSQRTLRVIGFMAVALERQRFSLEMVYPIHDTHPDAPLPVFENSIDDVVSETVGIERRVAVSDGAATARIDPDQAAA